MVDEESWNRRYGVEIEVCFSKKTCSQFGTEVTN